MFVRLTETGFTILCTWTREAWYHTTVRLGVRQKAGPASIFRSDRVIGNVQWWFKERFRPVITEVLTCMWLTIYGLHVGHKLLVHCTSQVYLNCFFDFRIDWSVEDLKLVCIILILLGISYCLKELIIC